MNKFISNVLWFCVFLATIFLVMISVVFFVHTDVVCDAYGIELCKRERLRNTGDNRIVLIGGSGLCYGIDSEKLSAAFNREVVNMGFTAALGLCWQLRSAQLDIHKGDWVVIVPEYSNFKTSGDGYGDGQTLNVLADILPFDMWPRLPLDFWLQRIPDIPLLCLSRIKRKVFKSGVHMVEPPEYYNKYGDYIAHRHYINPKSRIGIATALSETDFSDKIIDEIKLFARSAEKRNAKVFLFPPVFHAESFDNQAPFIANISSSLESVDLPFDAPPERYRFDESLLYDTFWHCNGRGVAIRTDRLVEDLKAALLIDKHTSPRR